MNDSSRLIEHAFPLKQASLDSVHEKMCHAGHIKAIHIWPARRPLAACRAALIATLLPDPGTPEKRKELCEKIGGKLVKKIERKKMPDGSIVEREKEETEGGILHWGRETENKADLDWFRSEILKANGGRAPKVLDPFAGGGAIPLEAMRLGCEATAVDINPVAWFIEKCTLEYPQMLAGKTHPLPEFILDNEEFMNAFYKAHPHLVGRTKKTKKQTQEEEGMFPQLVKEDSGRAPKADLAWHVRAWGQWVLDRARRDLAQYYPTYADFEPLDNKNSKPYEKRPMQLVPFKDDGTPDINALNKEFSNEYLADKKNPRWVAKPTVAYLWARTVKCKNCRAMIPLLKTRWLSKKKDGKKRVLLTMTPTDDLSGVVFGIDRNVPLRGGNAAQKREHDKNIAAPTMNRSGAKCPCCGAIMTMEDIRLDGKAKRLGTVMTAVVQECKEGKFFRLPTTFEIEQSATAASNLTDVFSKIPFGLPDQFIEEDAKRNTWCVQYGLEKFTELFTARQLIAIGRLLEHCSGVRDVLRQEALNPFADAITSYLACAINKVCDYNSALVAWQPQGSKGSNTFQRWALPLKWDFCENNILDSDSGGWSAVTLWVTVPVGNSLVAASQDRPEPTVLNQSAITSLKGSFDAIVTDPPYYDSIGYAVLMDFFYVWLRRSVGSLFPENFAAPLVPKWEADKNDGELVDDASRHGGDREKSKKTYEDGMARVFSTCHAALKPEGRLVVVFAHKHPNAWETLVSAIIRTGFVVDGSWPIQTEMGNRTRSQGSSALASSVWLVCRKRSTTARAGWDNQVLDDMRTNIRAMLREFWDAGIRGPDFVWAATGPAMEAYSKHPVVKKANEPGPLTVSEFLTHVRRIVVDFVVGRVLSGDKVGDADLAAADRLDEPTTYYLLHRNDFGMDEAPAGACILYAVSCGISDRDLSQAWDLISYTKGKSIDEDAEDEPDMDSDGDAEEEESGSKMKLKTWAQRRGKSLGYEAPGGKPIPLIDRVHCLMHLWKAGDLSKVDGYLDSNGLRRHELFKRLLQSLIELSPHGSEERSLMESISNHVGARGAVKDDQMTMALENGGNEESDNG